MAFVYATSHKGVVGDLRMTKILSSFYFIGGCMKLYFHNILALKVINCKRFYQLTTF